MSALCLGELVRAESLTPLLAVKGLGPEAAARKASLFSSCAQALLAQNVPPAAHAEACFVPGRIEVLGKHTDYAGGSSMLVAVEQGFCVTVAPRDDASLCVTDAANNVQVEFEFHAELVPNAGHWSNYPMTVARRLARNFPGPLKGAAITFASDLPPDAGMSSSSALIVATYLALASINGLSDRPEYRRNVRTREDLAGYLATIENGMSFGDLVGDRGVGTFGGSEDHTAILCAEPDRIIQYAYCPVRRERSIAVPEGHVFAVAVSGVVADKTGSALEKYNRVAKLAAAATDLWRRATGRDDPHLAAAIASSADARERLLDILATESHPDYATDKLRNRVEQFWTESADIIPAAADELARGRIAEFGELVDRSQELGARWLENQTPETVWLAGAARDFGAAAASAFGAGFGGAVWALVRESVAATLLERWSAAYTQSFPQAAARSAFFTSQAGPPAFQLDEP